MLGIQVKGKKNKICQFADDTTCFVRNKTSIDKLLMILDNFGKCSGLKINTEKTEAMWLGSLRGNKSKPFGFKWPEESIVALGVSFSYNVNLTTQRIFEDKVTKLEKQLNLWRQRDLTLIGRITITKTLALAKLLYCASVLSVPKNIVQKVNNLVYTFLWKGKKAKIKKPTLIGERSQRSFEAPDFNAMDTSLKALWVRRLRDKREASWKIIPNHYMEKFGGDILFHTRLELKDQDLFDFMPPFYCEVLKNWQTIKDTTQKIDTRATIEKELQWKTDISKLETNQLS